MTPSRPPGRSKSEVKRQQMIDAASELFLSHGFENTSMDHIAEKSAVSKQTVYSHFGNKEELFAAIIEYKCLSHSITDALFDLSKPVKDVLNTLAKDFSELINSDEAIRLWRVCIASSGQRSKVSEIFWTAGPQKLKSKLTHYLEQQTELDIPNKTFATQQFFSLMKGEVYTRRELGLSVDKAIQEHLDYLNSAVNLFIKGYSNDI